MADYFPVLSRAVAGLENNTGEARRAVYERARAAIVKQLRAIDPPLSEEDISRERMQLEEAIRRVEAQSGASAPSQPAAKSPPAPRPQAAPAARPSEPPAGREPPQRAPQRPQAPARPQPQDDVDDERAAPPGRSGPGARPGGPPQARPAKRPDGRPIIQAAGQESEGGKPRRSGLVLGLVALGVIALGVGVFLVRDQFMSSGGQQDAQQQAAEPSGTPPAQSDGEKSSDRLTQDGQPDAGQQAATPAQPEQTPPPAEEQVARGPDPVAPQPPAQPAAPAEPAPGAPQVAPVAQRAVLYEEGPNQQSGEALNGTIVWRNESVNGGQSQPLETAIRGDIDIPGRGVKATLTIRRNADATLPASHTIEIQFQLPENFPNAGVSNVPGLLMKADEAARGAAVAGLSVRVTNGFFLIGLSNLDTERSVNEQLLRDRGWIDIPILYDNGRRAVLTLEKGTPGSQAFQEAFSAWRSASAGAPGGSATR